MRIRKISVFKVDLPFKAKGSLYQKVNSPKVLDSTIVQIDTGEEISGFGESCPIGPMYLPACAETARAGIEVIAPHLLGQDPLQIGCIEHLMDSSLKGHPHAKSALDIACWDILSKKMGYPLYMLLGGKFTQDIPLVQVIALDEPEEMLAGIQKGRSHGYRDFQVKVGAALEDDIERIRMTTKHLKKGERIFVDANCAWTSDEAMRVVNAVRDCDFYLEQPCETYEACLRVSRKADQPFILDESIVDVPALLRALKDSMLNGIVLKISNVGGISKAMTIIKICVAKGIRMRIEDTTGTEFVRAAVGHLAVSVPPASLLCGYEHCFEEICTADGAPLVKKGRLCVSDRPGLGVRPKLDVLKDPIAVFE